MFIYSYFTDNKLRNFTKLIYINRYCLNADCKEVNGKFAPFKL